MLQSLAAASTSVTTRHGLSLAVSRAVCTHLDTLLGCVSSRGWGSQCSRAISTSTSTPSLSFNPWLPHSLPATRSITTRPGGVPITTRHGKGLAAGHERHLTPLLQHHEPAVSAQLVLPQESAAAAAAAEAEAEAETYEAEAEGSNIEMVADMGGAHPAAHLQRASLQEGLAEAGLSFPAIMAVLRILGKISRVNITLDRALSSFAALQNYFGPDRANSLVLALPSILARRPEPLLQNFECLVEVLGGGRAFALAMITAAPDLIIRRPSVIAERMELLCKLFEVDQAQIRRLVRKAPSTLKVRPERMQELVTWLHGVTGLSTDQVFKTLLRWPVMATTSASLLQARYTQLQVIFGVDDTRMRAICKTYPNVLGRDPAQVVANLASLAQHMQLPEEQMGTIAGASPYILSWNVSTLLSRITLVCQVLRLPAELRPTLLGANRPLVDHHSSMAERVDFLSQALQLPESELLPLLHKQLSVLRLPVDLMREKWAVVSSLALLHPPWAQEYAAATPVAKLYMLQCSVVRFWRLAYLVQTGQQHTRKLNHALKEPHAVFSKRFPTFIPWLDRYNSIVCDADIPVVPSAPHGAQGPTTYPAIFLDATLGRTRHAGGVSTRDQAAAVQLGYRSCRSRRKSDGSSSNRAGDAGGGGSNRASDAGAAAATAAVTSSHSSSSGGSDRLLQLQQQGVKFPGGPAGMLAAWLGVGVDVAEPLLPTSSKNTFLPTPEQMHEHIAPLEGLLSVLGYLEQPANGDGSSSSSTSVSSSVIGTSTWVDGHGVTAVSDGSSTVSGASSPVLLAPTGGAGAGTTFGAGGAAGAAVAAAATPQLEKHGAGGSSADTHGGTGQQQLVQAAAPRSRQRRRRHSSPSVGLQQEGVQVVKPTQQLQSATAFELLPTAHAALGAALESRCSVAVAAVSLAAHLAPFTSQLLQLPPQPPDLVVQLMTGYPNVVLRHAFSQNCAALTGLVAASPHLKQLLKQQGMPGLMACLNTTQLRMGCLQYLVQSQQPTPWQLSLKQLLVDHRLYPGKRTPRAAFAAAYPGFVQWEEGMKSI